MAIGLQAKKLATDAAEGLAGYRRGDEPPRWLLPRRAGHDLVAVCATMSGVLSAETQLSRRIGRPLANTRVVLSGKV